MMKFIQSLLYSTFIARYSAVRIKINLLHSAKTKGTASKMKNSAGFFLQSLVFSLQLKHLFLVLLTAFVLLCGATVNAAEQEKENK